MKLIDQVIAPLLAVFQTFSGESEDELNIPAITNVFGFYSVSGGVGITTTVVNLATVLAQHKKVAILDLDLLHPSVYNYLVQPDKDGKYIREDITEKFNAAGADIVKYGTDTVIHNVKLFSCLPEGDVIKYCDLDYESIRMCISDLSDIYDYVLIDIKGSILQETVVAAIEECTRVYTFIRPWMSDVIRVRKEIALLKRYGFGSRLKNVIQSPVSSSPIDPGVLKDAGLTHVMSIPYVKKVEDIGFNFGIFVNADGGSDKYAKNYIACITYLAERIANYKLEEVVSDGTDEGILDKKVE